MDHSLFEEYMKELEMIKGNIFNQTKRKVSKRDFKLVKCLGRGAHGKVLLVESKIDGKYYAMKILKKSKII